MNRAIEGEGAKSDDQREPYEAPRLETEELFEVLALACGKVNPTSRGCLVSPRTS